MRRYSGFRWMQFIIGILLVILGIWTLSHPGAALTGLVLLYGLLAVLTGIADILFYVKMERYTGFGPILSLISGILSVMAGVMLLVYPGAGSIAAAVLFPLWFLAHCISRLATQPRILKFLNPFSYYLTLVLNILGLILAVLMLFNPAAAFLSLDTIIGCYLVLLGIDSIVLAFSARKGDMDSRW